MSLYGIYKLQNNVSKYKFSIEAPKLSVGGATKALGEIKKFLLLF